MCVHIGRWPSALAARPAYTVLNTVLWRGELCSPSNPSLSRRCRSTSRTGAPAPEPPHRRAPRAAAHRGGRQPRHAGRPRRPRRGGGPPAPPRRGSGPTRPSAASESPGSPPWSTSRTTRWSKTWLAAASTRPWAASLPSRRDHSRRRRGLERPLHPGTTGVTSTGCRGCRSVDRRGVVPSPALRPKGEERIRRHAGRTQRGQRVCRNTPCRERGTTNGIKGGLSLSRANATPRAAPPRTNDSPESGRSRAWHGTPGQPAIPADRYAASRPENTRCSTWNATTPSSPRRSSPWRRVRKPS